MKCFKLIKDVLDEIYAELPAADRDARIRAELTALSKSYKTLLRAPVIDYANPAARIAYIFRYVTSHANMVYQIIDTCDELRKCLDKSRVVLTCVGGGPGSDLLGVLKYLEENGKFPQLSCWLLDRERL